MDNNSIDLLVVSTACHTAINRRVYSDILLTGKSVVLVVPVELKFGSNVVKADLPVDNDPHIEYLKLIGSNARANFFVGIFGVIRKYNPQYIVVDNDPASIMVLQLTVFSRIISRAKIFCLSCENLPLTMLSTYKRRGFRGMLPFFYKRIILGLCKRIISGVFVINDEGYQIFKSEGVKHVCKIPLGFDSNYFYINPKSRRSIREQLEVQNKFVISYFGRISYEKGIHVLVSALSKLLDYDWVLLMDEFDRYHSSYGQTIYKQINNDGISDRVIFSSPSHTEIGGFMNAADVVVMPSITTPVWVEQYGRVAPESMACGKIVIASDTGAIPMLLNGYGLLFDEGNVNDLVNKLKSVILDEGESFLFNSQEISDYAHESLNTTKQAESMLSFMESV